jgi:transposase
MASTEIRNRRRILRYRNLVLRQTVQMKNRVSGLLMETGVSYNKLRLHRLGYFAELMSTNEEVSESIRPLLRLCRDQIDRSIKQDTTLLRSLERDPLLTDRLRRLRTIPGVGPITALTWALEVGDTSRFRSIKQAISYCGLCGEERSSADKVMRTPLSKQRNKHIQHVLVEAAKLAPRQCHELALVHEREMQKGIPVNHVPIVVPMNAVGSGPSPREDGLLPTMAFARVFISYSKNYAAFDPWLH